VVLDEDDIDKVQVSLRMADPEKNAPYNINPAYHSCSTMKHFKIQEIFDVLCGVAMLTSGTLTAALHLATEHELSGNVWLKDWQNVSSPFFAAKTR
jgi:hypothetical protein